MKTKGCASQGSTKKNKRGIAYHSKKRHCRQESSTKRTVEESHPRVSRDSSLHQGVNYIDFCQLNQGNSYSVSESDDNSNSLYVTEKKSKSLKKQMIKYSEKCNLDDSQEKLEDRAAFLSPKNIDLREALKRKRAKEASSLDYDPHYISSNYSSHEYEFPVPRIEKFPQNYSDDPKFSDDEVPPKMFQNFSTSSDADDCSEDETQLQSVSKAIGMCLKGCEEESSFFRLQPASIPPKVTEINMSLFPKRMRAKDFWKEELKIFENRKRILQEHLKTKNVVIESEQEMLKFLVRVHD